MMSAWVATRTTCSGFFSLPPKAGGRKRAFHRGVLLPGCLPSLGEGGRAGLWMCNLPTMRAHPEKAQAWPTSG